VNSTQSHLDLERLPEDQQEDEGDLKAGKIKYGGTVSMTVDWTIETIFSQVEKGNIELDPAFQRRAAWDAVRKSRLVESLVVGMPVPNIVLAENRAHRGRYIVIDGKQRVLAISEFMQNKFALKGLDIRTDLDGLIFSDLSVEDRSAFENATFRSTVIKGWSDEQFLYAIFFRLNSGSLALSPQELRRAIVGGNLLDAIENYIQQSSAFHSVISATLDRRMRDSELVLRFVAFDRRLEDYDGDLKNFLDETAKLFEQNWAVKQSEVVQYFHRLDRALVTADSVFGGQPFKKWTDDHYERVINRAVFDVIARFFAEEDVAKASLAKAAEIENEFKRVSMESEFRQAVERTTKTELATKTRINMWGVALATCIGMKYDSASMRVIP